MATQKVCDECGAVGDETEVSRRALLVSKDDAGTVHIHIDASVDKELCDKCMKVAFQKLAATMEAPRVDLAKVKCVTLMVSRIQPK